MRFDYIALFLAVVASLLGFAFYQRRNRKPEEPVLSFSVINDFKVQIPSWKQRYAKLPTQLSFAALFLFLLAFIDPHFFVNKGTRFPGENKIIPTEGIAIYLLLDQSGSMKEIVEAVAPNGSSEMISKIDLLKQVTKAFIEGDPSENLPGRTDDLLGLIEFARIPNIQAPLTLDHSVILDKLAQFHAVQNPDEDGTAMGYAIYKTANIIAATRHFAEDLISKGKPAYTIKNSIIVVVTDGLQFPSPLDKGNRLRNIDLDEAAQYAKDHQIKVYIVNVDPQVASDPDLAPQRNLMKRITELTGGKFYLVTKDSSLNQIYADIDKLEKSSIPEDEIAAIEAKKREQLLNKRRLSLYPFLIACGLICLAASIFLETTKLKRIP